MNKSVLLVATVPSMIGQFNMNNIKILQNMGYKVEIAADFLDTSVWPTERTQAFKNQMNIMGIGCLQIDFSRSPLKFSSHIKAYKEIIQYVRERKYAFIHTHTPIASAIVRLVARKTNTKVVYTAHGFHFYDGAPLKNWIIFYPIEKLLSKYTDILITINKEDYNRAVGKFNAKKIFYIPGVGVDTEKFKADNEGRRKIRNELGLQDDQIMLLSVGELNANKNHESVVRAVKDMNITYVVVGKGTLKERLENVAKECNVDLRLMGFRSDVADFYRAADIYILPSKREGLNVSLMEAMASGLPVTCGRIRGNTDLIKECLFKPTNISEIRKSIEECLEKDKDLAKSNLEKIQKFKLQSVEKSMCELYSSL